MNKITVTKKFQFSGHKDGVYRLEQGPEPHLFFSGAGDGFVVLWDLTKPDEGQLIGRLNNSVYALEYWKEKDLLLVGHNYDGIHILDWRKRKEVASLNFTEAAIFDIKTRGNKAYVATGNGELVVISLDPLQVEERIRATDQRVRSIALHPEATEAAVGYSDHAIRIFDLKTLSLKKEIKSAHENSVFSLQYTSRGDRLLSCGRDARIKEWDVQNNYFMSEEVIAHMYTINHLTFSPDGHYFVSCSMDKSIKVWEASTLKLLKVIDKGRHASHGTSVNRLLWTPFNNWLLSASDDHSIAAWEITF